MTKDLHKYLEKLLSEALGSMFEDGEIFAIPEFKIEIPKDSKQNNGDYTTNAAFSIAKDGKFNPNEVANLIARKITELDAQGEHQIREIKTVGGFVNFYLDDAKKAQQILQFPQNIEIEQVGLKADGTAKKVVFEYSSPNTNKPLHIGHTRNDLFGMACIRLLRTTGHQVIACEIINDRGVHIMKSMLMYIKHGNGATPESAGEKPDHFVGKFYAMFGEESAKSESAAKQLEEEAQELLRKWEAGDSATRELWQKMNNWFFSGVKITYAQEGSEFDEVEYESNIYDQGREIILDGAAKGIFTKEDDGSISVDLSGEGLDKKYLLRKDGTTIYITQDIYLWNLRNQKHHPDLAVVTTSAEQAYHFAVLGKIFEKLGYEWAGNFKHLPYEHVFLGKNKMSSRAGNAVTADALLEMTKEKVRETMANSQKVKASADDDKTVQAIAFGAIKYGYLKYDRNTKIYFDLDETIAIEGNTGPYIQYAYARIQSILRESGESKFADQLNLLTNALEQNIIRHLLYYPQTIVNATNEFKPNLICNYLFELCGKFNAFYDQLSVLKAESEDLKQQRLALINSVAAVLRHGLNLLGIEAVEKI